MSNPSIYSGQRFPSGTVTFLFTDIEGSTKLAQQYPEQWETLRARHHAILQSAIGAQNGYVFQIVGDSFCVAFSSPIEALNAALDVQHFLIREEWSPAPLKVRMGIHTGTAQLQEDGQYTGYTALASTQRIMSIGHGGQILLSGSTRELVRDTLPAGTELLDMGEKRLKDLLRPEHLYQLNVSGLPVTFPPLKSLDSFPNNLPMQLTTFIGREQEIVEIKKELQSHRVVTLTGSGGAGKTRLSLEVGAACLEQFKNGIWFVELAALTDPALIISAVLSAFGVHEKENDTQSLANFIGNQSLLLILDNCEHLIEDCTRLVASLIQLCPKLHILASSREAFGIAGEQLYHVPSLSFADPKRLPALDEIAKCEAVQLFVERVKTYMPSFSLTERNAPSIAQICCRLDGIPLALELAAARVKVMSVEQLASRLGDMFNLLTSGSRTALPRHQTLRALIEWSYDLLSEPEQNLFRKLSVFSGGWTLEAAESICKAEGRGSVLENLARLVDKSLVNKEELDGEARFHMLETIRQYAEFKMFASEEVEQVKNSHRDWFMQLVETAEPKLRTDKQLVWLNRLEMEHDNLRAAMQWSVEQKHVEQALRISSALAYFWEIHGHNDEGRNWLSQALALDAQSNERKHPFAWAKAVDGHFNLTATLPNPEQYRPRMQQALDIFRKHGDAFWAGRVLYHLAYIPHFAGEFEDAYSTYQAGFDFYQTIDDKWGMGECLHCMAHTLEGRSIFEESHKLYNQSLDFMRAAGDRYSLFHPMGDMAVIAFNKGELSKAKSILEESTQAFEELKNRIWNSISINRLTEVLYEQGKYENAREMNLRHLEVVRKMGDPEQLGWAVEITGKIELAEGNLSVARQIYNEALAVAEKHEYEFREYTIGFRKAALGLIDCYEGHYPNGKAAIEFGIEKVQKKSTPDASSLLPYRGHALWLEKDLPGAVRSYHDAVLELRNNYFFIRIPECLEGLGKIAVLQNDLEHAACLFGAAEAMRARMGTLIPPIQRGDYDAHMQMLREKMGNAMETTWSTGHKMTFDEIVAYALE